MADEDRESRTEEPTPRRLERAREQGELARSVELTGSLVLFACTLVASMQGHTTIADLRRMMQASLRAVSAQDLTPGQTLAALGAAGSAVGNVAGPLALAAAGIALLATIAQVGFGFYPSKLAFDASRLSPLSGLQRIFSRRGAVELLKAVLKIAVVSWLAWQMLRGAQEHIAALGLASPREILDVAGGDLSGMLLRVTGALTVLSLLDYAWQRRELRGRLRMTRQEIKEEHRQQEGDPKIKQRVRKAYRELTGNAMLSEVANADVVLTNPVHVAVALRYAPDEMGAPTVVAKGAERVAERIKQAARRAGVPIVERRALARALFRSVPVGAEIPAALYRAVAEILAYIYGLRARRAS